ncbi:16S rRNA (uracil(1498)-N(3))-methyltransferase [soil metagenome]
MSLPVHQHPDLTEARIGDLIELIGDEAHHAVAVRRLRVGESVVLTDGRGTSVTGRITQTGKQALWLRADQVRRDEQPSPSITVVQAIPKGERGELAVEVLTEIGVSRIVPWAASRSVAIWKGDRAEKSLAKWRGAAVQAAKQARRTWFPEVDSMQSTSGVLDLITASDVAIMLHEEAGRPLSSIDYSGRLLVVVGPEGGLSEDEVGSFETAGAVAVRLGEEVLRTSTAGVAAVAAILSRTSRWGA